MLHRLCSLGYAEMMLPNPELEIFLVIERHFCLCFEILKNYSSHEEKTFKIKLFPVDLGDYFFDYFFDIPSLPHILCNC